MTDTTLALLEAVVTLVTLLITGFLLPKGITFANSKIGEKNTNMLLTWADAAVKEAEQVVGAGAGKGDTKMDLAYSALQAFAERNKINVTEAALTTALEAAVHQLKTAKPVALVVTVPDVPGQAVLAPITPPPA